MVCSKGSINMIVLKGIPGALKPLTLLFTNRHNLSIKPTIGKIVRSLAFVTGIVGFSCGFPCPYCSICATVWPTVSPRKTRVDVGSLSYANGQFACSACAAVEKRGNPPTHFDIWDMGVLSIN